MHSPGINEEGELRGQPANPGSPGKWPFKRRERERQREERERTG